MNLERTIAEIEWLERLFSLPDTRPLQLTDLYTVNQRRDEMYASNPCSDSGSGAASEHCHSSAGINHD